MQLSQKSGQIKKKIKLLYFVATTNSICVGAGRLGVRVLLIGANQRLRKWHLLHSRNNAKMTIRQLSLVSAQTEQVIYLSSFETEKVKSGTPDQVFS